MLCCANCRFENPPEMKFCGQCGRSLNRPCPYCTYENPANFKFCGQCGTALSEPADRPSPLEIDRPGPAQTEPERRQLTVMFCDLVGSTRLSQQLDPEELHQVVGAYQAVCVAVIDRFEGHVAQYLGDGLLVYFGYPAAHEDDAPRAVQAGLGIIAAIERLNTRLAEEMKLELSLRLGIHTGLVVVGPIGSGERHERLALGDTPNIAARLQQLAAPNTILVSPTTHRLVDRLFASQALGPQTLTGLAGPLAVYQILHERGHLSRLEATAMAARLSPLIGREQELALLLARWDQVKEGVGQVVSLNGEAGIGKSRLLHDLKSHLAGQPQLWLEGQCSPYYKNSAFYPLIELAGQQIFCFERADTPRQKLAKLEATVNRLDGRPGLRVNPAEAIPLLAGFLSLPLEPDYDRLTLSPQRQKQRTLETLLTLLFALAGEQPLLLVWEDLHWADPSTLEFIDLLIRPGSPAPIFVLLTFRPTFTPPWSGRSQLTHLILNRLNQSQVEQLIAQLAPEVTLPAELHRQVVVKTDGVPLFVEEVTKMVLELGDSDPAQPASPLTIPITLQDSLMARLDRLARGKEVAQLGAILGREFSYDLLLAVAGRSEAILRRDLAALVEAELLYQHGLPPQATYFFKHALLQEAAYQTMLRRKRQHYHRTIAQTLTDHFPEIAGRQPELLAHHYALAGLNEAAVQYFQAAAQQALGRSANLEAIEHLTSALALLKTWPDSPARTQQQLALQIALGGPYLMTKGYAALAVEQLYAEAWQLCQSVGDAPQRAAALFGLWVFYLVRADYVIARQLGDQIMAVAQEPANAAFLLEAHQVQGINHFYLGEFAAARHHLEQAMQHAPPDAPPVMAGNPGPNSGANAAVACLCHAALTLWLLGYPDQARQRIEAALALARRLAHPYSQVFALAFMAWLHQYRREGSLAEQHAEAAMTAAGEHAFELLLPFSLIFKGWAMAEQGRPEAGIVLLKEGLTTYLATGAELGRLHFLALLAETHGRLGQPEAGLQILADAISGAADKGERFYEAELYRLKGELLRQQGGPSAERQAEHYFQQALNVARRQQAKALELRAAVSLSRLWLGQGKRTESDQLLSDIYNWFQEGANMADHQEAVSLLEQLC